jgi:hypothetical protein
MRGTDTYDDNDVRYLTLHAPSAHCAATVDNPAALAYFASHTAPRAPPLRGQHPLPSPAHYLSQRMTLLLAGDEYVAPPSRDAGGGSALLRPQGPRGSSSCARFPTPLILQFYA